VALHPVKHDQLKQSMEMTLRWAKRCKDAKKREDQALFGIIQGGMHKDLRLECTGGLLDIGFDGYAIGGLSVGETKPLMYEVVAYTAEAMPADRPRYLMGVGLRKTARASSWRIGVGVMPTRNARRARCSRASGKHKNAKYAEDESPVDPNAAADLP
jgi:queuine tRNA-ribosyltransferase